MNPADADAYLRLRPSGRPPLYGTVPEVPGSLVFIDVEPPAAAVPNDGIAYLTKSIVGAPPGFFLQAREVLVRWPFPAAGGVDLVSQARDLADLVSSRSARAVRVGFVLFPIGEDASIVWGTGATEVGKERALLARARAAELMYLLKSGGGIWRPIGYHYALPSGVHSRSFIRLADAFKRPRDPVALATWLHRELQPGIAIVTDSPTLMPLTAALEAAMRSSQLGAPQIVMLSDYPSNHFEVEHAVADIEGAEHVVGIVSVSSTGTTVRRIATALDRGQISHTLDTLVARGSAPAFALPTGQDPPARKAWVAVGDDADIYARHEECQLCREPDSARIVYIDPRSFEPLVLPRPDLLTPAIREARTVRELWQFYDAVGGSGIHAQPHHTTREFRSNRPKLAVRCYPHWLLDPDRYVAAVADEASSHQRFLAVIRDRAKAIAEDIAASEANKEPEGERFDPHAVDVIVTTDEDGSATGFEGFAAAVCEGFGVAMPEVIQVPKPHSAFPSEIQLPAGVRNILVLTLGAITGTTMQQVLLGLHTLIGRLDGDAPQIAGLVLHSRSEDEREWLVLRNAYTRLHAIWRTPLSLNSPFDEEEALLGVWAPQPEDGPANDFYEQRLAFLNANDPDWEIRSASAETAADPWAVFWGMPLAREHGADWSGHDTPRLRPGSLYGHRLNSATTFAAVGSAMQRARLESLPTSAPILQQFEMPAILRSYFDPPIVAAVLRWLEPHEAWWGVRSEDAAHVLAEALARADDTDRKLLLPEFLLSAALGKVPEAGIALLVAQASHCLWCWENGLPFSDRAEPWSDAEVGPVQLGLGLVRADHGAGGDHLDRVRHRVQLVSQLLDAGIDTASRSLATANLLWALDRFTQAFPEPE
jgi:hypothetical protein